MRLTLPVVLLSALALAAPGAVAHAKEKDKEKDKITICHIPPGNHSARHTISVGASAWPAHERHGDHSGACDHGGAGGTNQDRPRFEDMDANRDGGIALREWRGDRATFDRLNRNNDGSISRDEFSRY